MILTTVCFGMHTFTGTLAAPQNDERGLHWFGIVWLHLLQHQKVGVSQMLLISPLCLLGCPQAVEMGVLNLKIYSNK